MSMSKSFGKIVLPNNFLSIIRKSKQAAEKYQFIYHCTTTDSFFSIIRTHEFWLRNLKCVNDQEEAENILLPEYTKNFFISSFTYKDNVAFKHWKEYASMNDGILFSVSQKWFYRNAQFMNSDNVKIDIPILSTAQQSTDEFLRLAHYKSTREIEVFGLYDFDFYKIKYSRKNPKVDWQEGQFVSNEDRSREAPIDTVIVNIAGVVKNRKGICRRPGRKGYIKKWSAEKEVRLKIRIQKAMTDTGIAPLSDKWYEKAAVSLNDAAFDNLIIRFSPKYPKKEKIITLEKLKEILPESKIKVLG